MRGNVSHMNEPAKKIDEISKEQAEDDLIAQIGKLLAKEYIAMMKEPQDEGRDLRPLFEREPKTAEH